MERVRVLENKVERERGAEFGETDHADGTACHVAPRRRVEKHLLRAQG